jgi:chromosome segregation ATPase
VYEKCLSCVAAHQKCSHSPVAAGSAPAVGRAAMKPQISEELDGIERRLAAVVGEEARMTEVIQGCRTRLEVTQQTVTKAQVDVQESEDAWRTSTEDERLAFEAMVAAQEHWQTMVRETHSKADEVRTAQTKKQPLADKLESEKKELEVLEVKLEKTVKTKLGLEEDIKEWKALEEMYERVSKRARLA